MALREYTATFDKAEIADFRVTPEEIEAAVAAVEPEFLDAIAAAAEAIEDFHRRQLPQSWFTTQPGGIFLGQKVTPVGRAGIYVPGGRARYPSSVLMTAIPAIVAGVEEIVMVVPPAADGSVNPYTLAAAAEVGVDEIYRVGGAQAVAALAYGTDSIPRVDKIVGPGNAYVTAAKKLVMGDVGIDMLAGPSEVLVLADESAVPAFIAIDLMAQAEHDPRAATYLVTTDPELPGFVDEAIAMLLEESPRGDITARSLADNGVVIVCPDVISALEVSNFIAPEHLEVHMSEPVRAARQHQERRRDLPRPVDAGERRRLRGRPQPRAAHRRHRALLKPAVGRRLRQEVQRAVVQRRGARDPTPTSCSRSPAKRASGPTDAPCRCASRRSPRWKPRSPTKRVASSGRRPSVSARARRAGALRRQRGQGRGHPREQREPGNLPAELVARLAKRLPEFAFNRYPDPTARELRALIAEANGLDVENVLLGNGGDELIFDLLLAWGGPGRTILDMPPTFSMYGIDAQVTGTDDRAHPAPGRLLGRSRRRARAARARRHRHRGRSPTPTTPRAG